MYKTLSVLFFLFLIANIVRSQILPREGSVLNFRLIGFSFPFVKKADQYKLEIAKGIYVAQDSFEKKIIRTQSCKTNKIIVRVPSFGEQYTWRIVYTNSKSGKTISDLYHFSTGIISDVDTANVRLRIMHQAKKYKDAFVLFDNSKAMYDMKGRAVWFLPNDIAGNDVPGNIEVSKQGTITFLIREEAYEINYSGDILWKAPNTGTISGDSVEHYHHEFTRLANGHYMTLGNEAINWKHGELDNQTTPPKSKFGTLIEYDDKHNIVWSWKSSVWFAHSDIGYYNPAEPHAEGVIDVHANAFYFDEKGKYIYMGFKGISRILKIKYPEGKVVNSYGEIYKPGIPVRGNGLFCMQHSIRLSTNGYLYLFNNNPLGPKPCPKVMLLKEPVNGKGGLKKIWEYVCTFEGNQPLKQSKGGNVIELPDNSLFVCMGYNYSKTFIVSRTGKILWSALPEKWNPEEKKWRMIPQYRANIVVDHKILERLIWNGER